GGGGVLPLRLALRARDPRAAQRGLRRAQLRRLVARVVAPRRAAARALRGSHTLSDCVARPHSAARCCVLGRPDSETIGPPCVLASHSPIAPGSTNVIV